MLIEQKGEKDMEKVLGKVAIWGFEYDVEFDQYLNGNNALLLTRHDDEEGVVSMPASVNVGQLPESFVGIKNYSENEGVLDALIDAGYILEPDYAIPSGFVRVHACRLTPEATLLRDKQLSE